MSHTQVCINIHITSYDISHRTIYVLSYTMVYHIIYHIICYYTYNSSKGVLLIQLSKKAICNSYAYMFSVSSLISIVYNGLHCSTNSRKLSGDLYSVRGPLLTCVQHLSGSCWLYNHCVRWDRLIWDTYDFVWTSHEIIPSVHPVANYPGLNTLFNKQLNPMISVQKVSNETHQLI